MSPRTFGGILFALGQHDALAAVAARQLEAEGFLAVFPDEAQVAGLLMGELGRKAVADDQCPTAAAEVCAATDIIQHPGRECQSLEGVNALLAVFPPRHSRNSSQIAKCRGEKCPEHALDLYCLLSHRSRSCDSGRPGKPPGKRSNPRNP